MKEVVTKYTVLKLLNDISTTIHAYSTIIHTHIHTCICITILYTYMYTFIPHVHTVQSISFLDSNSSAI